MNDFLPTNYEVPEQETNYLKFKKEGTYTFRILSSAIVGWSYWTNDKKPVRSKVPFEEVPEDAKLDKGQFKPKHFWAFLVYNYDAKRVQILEITQKTIQETIQAYVENPKWGSPLKYDIAVTRTGMSMDDTEYTTIAEPHSEAPVLNVPVPKIDLQQLFEGKDPFAV